MVSRDEENSALIERLQPPPKDAPFPSFFDRFTILTEVLHMNEDETSKAAEYLQSAEWLSVELIDTYRLYTGNEDERRHWEESKVADKVPELTVSLSFRRLLEKTIEATGANEDRRQALLRDFELLGAKDTDVSISFALDKEDIKAISTPQQKKSPLANLLTRMGSQEPIPKAPNNQARTLFEQKQNVLKQQYRDAQDIVLVRHGWTGSGPIIISGEEVVKGKPVEIDIMSNIFTTIEDANRIKGATKPKPVGITFSRLGMGKMELKRTDIPYGQPEDERFTAFVENFLGAYDPVVSVDDYDNQYYPEKQVVVLGHSMGGNVSFNLSADSSNKLPEHVVVKTIAANPATKHKDPEKPDPNIWNQTKVLRMTKDEAIKFVAAHLISGTADDLGKIMSILPMGRAIYGSISPHVARIIVEGHFLPQESRKLKKLAVNHATHFDQGTAAATATSRGNREQPGVDNITFQQAYENGPIIFTIAPGDKMVDAQRLLGIMPTPQERMDQGLVPLPLLLAGKDGGHYYLFTLKGQQDMRIMQLVQLGLTPEQFDSMLWAVYKAKDYNQSKSDVGFQECMKRIIRDPFFLQQETVHVPNREPDFITILSDQFNIDSSDIKNYIHYQRQLDDKDAPLVDKVISYIKAKYSLDNFTTENILNNDSPFKSEVDKLLPLALWREGVKAYAKMATYNTNPPTPTLV